MKTFWAILLAAAALACAAPAFAAETDEDEPLSTAKLTVEEAGRLLATGRAAYEDGLYRLARRRLEELVAGAPDKRRQAEGALWLARVELAAERPEQALATLDAYVGGARAQALAANYAWTRAEARFAQGQLAEAAAELDGFREKYVAQDVAPVALRLLARIFMARQDWSGAERVVELIEARHPKSSEAPSAAMELAAALAVARQNDRALATLARIETNYAGQIWSERAALKAIELQLAQGRRPETMDRLREMAANKSLRPETRAQGYRLVAEALGAETNYPAALKTIDQSIAAAENPVQRLESQVAKARLLLQSGATEEGRELLRGVAAKLPDETRAARLQLGLADELARMAKWDEAAAEYQVWLDAFAGAPGTAQVLAGRGWALWSAGRPEEAAAAYAQAAELETDPARRLELRQKLGDAQFASRRFSQAKEAYAAALAAAPTGSAAAIRAQLQLAESELELGETEAGEIRLLDLSRTEPATEFSRAAAMRLGSLYEDRGALESAIEQYGRVVETCAEPESCAQALLARGLIRYRMGAFAAAMDDFTRIRDEMPRTKPAEQAAFMRGWCFYLLGKDAEALRVCEQFLKDYPASEFAPDVRFWLGEHAFNHGDFAEGERRFAEVAAEYPDRPRAADALFWAGRAATAQRKYLAANEHYNALMARYPDSARLAETLLAQGDVLSELGQFAAAILAFNEVIVKFPQTPEALVAWGRKGDCQYTLGQETPDRYEEALLSYRTLLDFAGAPPDLRLQAGYKVGRCLEKMGRAAAALDRYMDVVYAFLQEEAPPAEANVWFTRAAFGAAALQENAGRWPEAARIYGRVAESGVPAAAEARARMDRIRQDHWTAP
ncbi:MAG: tetratricopeptide repeat protein [Spartobacteria bacterium]|nr:tetratricopeptide repeat protein [Spartobacteria bacterium]